MTISVAPASSNGAAIPVNPAPSSSANAGISRNASFHSTYADVQQNGPDESDPSAGDPKGKPGTRSGPQRKDSKDPALVAAASQSQLPSAPLLLLSTPALGNDGGMTNSAGARHSSTQPGGPESAPDPQPELQPLPLPPSGSRLVNEDLAFALRLLGSESAGKTEAATSVQATATDQPATQATPSAKTLALPETTIPGSNKDVVAASTRLPDHESGSTQEITALKSQPATSSGSPKTPPKQPSQDDSGKGSDNSHSDAEREAAPAPALKTVAASDAKSAAPQFAEVREVAMPSAPEPAAASDTKPLQTNAEMLVPLKADLPASAAAHDISLRLSGPDETSAVVRVLDRSGDIRVSVHAADPEIANSLRSDVDQLRSHLTSRGWDAEVWKPEGAMSVRESNNHGNSTSQEQQNSTGKRDGQNQNPSRRQNQSGKRPAWLDELEETALKGGQ